MGLTAGEVEYILSLRDTLSPAFAQAATQAQAHSATVSKAVKDVSDNSDKASLSVFQLRSAMREAFEGNIAGAVENLATSIGADLEGALHLSAESIGSVTLGLGVAAAAMGAAAGVGLYLAESAASVGSELERVSLMTGIGVEQLGALKFATEVTGGSLDSLAAASFMLEKRLGDTGPAGDKTRDALVKLGISARDFIALPVDKQILTLSDGFRALGADVNKQALIFELMGRQGREQLPSLLQPMSELADKARDLSLVLSEKDVKAAHDFEIASKTLSTELGMMKTNIGMLLIPALDELFKSLSRFGGAGASSAGKFIDPEQAKVASDFGHALELAAHDGAGLSDAMGGLSINIHTQAAELPGLIASNEMWTKKMEEANSSMKDLSGSQVDGIKWYLQNKASVEETAKAMGVYKVQVAQVEEALKKEVEAQKKYAEAVAQYQSLGTGYADLLDRIGASTYEGIAYDHARGASATELAQVYKVTTAQVEQVIKLEADAVKALAAEWKDVEESRAIGAQGMAAVNVGMGGGLDVLQHLSVAMGTTTIAGKQMVQEMLVPMHDWSHVTAQKMFDLADTIGKKLASSMEGIPAIMQQAFTGGGGLTGAAEGIGSMFGSTIGKSVAADLSTTMSKGGTQAIGALGNTMLAAIPVVGSLLGPAISGLIGLFHHGPSEAEIAAQKAYAAELQKNVGLFDQLATAEDKQAAAGRDWAEQNIIVTKAYVALGMTGNQAIADITEALNGQGDAQRAAIERINDATDAYKQLDAATKRYGFDTAATAAILIRDWTGLQNKGYDVSVVTRQMSKDINQYYLDALRVGAEIPQDMLPILQEMITLGKLTDDAGNKITALGSVSVDSFGKVMASTQGAVDKLSALGQAIAKLQLQTDTEGEFSGYVSASQPFYTPDEAIARIQSVYSHFLGRNANADEFAALEADFISKTGYTPGTNVNKSELESYLQSAAAAFMNQQIPHMAAGGSGMVDKPTLFLAGESGPEQYAFSGAGKTFGGDDGLRMLSGQLETLNRRLPTILALAVRDAIVQAV